MKKEIYSFYDKNGKLYVDCIECNRGRNGNDDACSAGWRHKKPGLGGCFTGTLLPKIVVKK